MKKKAFVNFSLLDGSEHMTPRPGFAMTVEGDKITAVGPEKELDTGGCEIIDLENQYLMPGLINMHVHIPAGGKPQKKPVDAKKTVKFATANMLTRKYLEHMYKTYVYTELLSGVTTFRSVGGIENYDTWIRDRIAAGKAVGPRILAGILRFLFKIRKEETE